MQCIVYGNVLEIIGDFFGYFGQINIMTWRLLHIKLFVKFICSFQAEFMFQNIVYSSLFSNINKANVLPH